MNYIELLFTEYYKLNPVYEKLYRPCMEHAEKIARYNNYTSINCMFGMVLEKYNALTHPYPSINKKQCGRKSFRRRVFYLERAQAFPMIPRRFSTGASRTVGIRR